MTGSLGPRLVLVTRETEYEQLLARHATRGQARTFLRQRAQTLETLDEESGRLESILASIRTSIPKGWRVASVRRGALDRFLFGPEDVVVAVGQDGLVANVAKYLSGQPVIGVNANPARNAGVLVPHRPEDVPALLGPAAAGTLATETRTMIRAELDDGQTLLALNEVFVGRASHQSARYVIRYDGREEAQSSSGVIVSTGTGATGWALSISRATGVSIGLAPEERAAMFLVREPWPSRATGADIVAGRLGTEDRLVLVSRMNEGGVVFADGIEQDRLEFGWGRVLTLSIAERQLRFVPSRRTDRAGFLAVPGAVPSRPVPGRPGPARPFPAPPVTSRPGPLATPPPLPAAPRRRSRGRSFVWRAFLVLVVVFVLNSVVRGCASHAGMAGPPGSATLAADGRQ